MSVWSPPNTEVSKETLYVSNRPFVPGCAGVVGLLLGVLPLPIPGISLPGKVAIFVVFGGFSLLVLFLARRRWTTLEVSSSAIRWKRPGVAFDLPRSTAKRVLISQSRWPLKDPTDYYLEVSIKEREVRLLIAEHWLWGGIARRTAESVAKELQIPISDPVGEMFRSSRFPLRRWMASGHEWAVVVLVLGVLGGLALLSGL